MPVSSRSAMTTWRKSIVVRVGGDLRPRLERCWRDADLAEVAAYWADQEELEQAARRVLDRSVEHAGQVPPGARVEPIRAYSGAASVILDAAKGAELLVVGSRAGAASPGLLPGL